MYEQIKNIEKEKLLEKIGNIPVKANLYKHQLDCLTIGLLEKTFGFFLFLGAGKTLISISIFAKLKELGKANKMLVICPAPLTNVWINEVKKFTNLTVSIVPKNPRDRIPFLLNPPIDITIISYETLVSTLKIKLGKKYIPNRSLIKQIKRFDILILDESHRVKNVKSMSFKIINELSNNIERRYLLTGTPTGNNLLDIYGQYYIIDKGKTFGDYNTFIKTFGTYIEKYKSYIPNRKAYKVIPKLIYKKAIRYTVKECLDLPEKTTTLIELDMPFDIKKQYKEFLENDNILEELGVKETAMLFRKLCGCFCDKFTPTKYYTNPKLEWIKEFINDIDKNEKIIIYHYFQEEGKILERFCEKLNISYISARGGLNVKKNIELFKNSDIQVLIANVVSVGLGFTLTECNKVIYYSHTVDSIIRKQSEDRVYRIGQKKPVFIYDLVFKDSIEYSIYYYVIKKRQDFKKFIDKENIENVLRGKI